MDDSKFLITGANGQLGSALRTRYPEATALASSQLDITDRGQLAAFDWSPYNTILNAAAYTAVDEAETAEGRRKAWAVNAQGTANLAQVVLERGLMLVHISTDYVFDGEKSPHTEAEPLSPLGVYGQSKAAGDLAVGLLPKYFILRTSWVIGNGKNFVRTMISLAQKGVSPTVVADQIGRPTFVTELARIIDHLLSTAAPTGVYNASNSGDPVSWADLTRTIFEEMKADLQVTDTTTAEYFAGKAGTAPRPLSSTFDLSKLEATGFQPHDWKDDLVAYIKKELE